MMRPDFGCGIHELVFESMSTTVLGLLESRIIEALTRWEPRINLAEVNVSTDEGQDGKLNIDIRFIVRSTNTEYNWVYPFYIKE
ncbi:Lysozyme [compost metagenome]